MIESGCHIVRVEDEIKESTDHIGQILGEAMDKWNQRLNAFAHQFLKSMEELRARVDEHFDEVDRMMRDNGAAFHNFAARVQNARLLRMHTAITPILVLRPGNSPNVFEWKPHAWAPKNMKDAYFLGQRAKGLLHSDRDRLSREAIEAGSGISFYILIKIIPQDHHSCS